MPDPIYERNSLIADRYVVQQLLGAGNFSYVYKVLDEHLSQVFALKLLKENTDALDRLRAEFNLLQKLNHPRIARIYDAGVLPDHSALYLKLEYIEGNTLDLLIREQRISLTSARQIIKDLLDAVGYLHSNHVLHRDIKPSNIISDGHSAVIVDFNIAKQVESHADSQVGTPPYMPPEVYSSGWTRAGDLYCVGIVLYEMLTGHRPFEKDGAREHPVNPADYNPRISPELAQCVLKAIQVSPQARYQSAAEMQTALDAVEWQVLYQPPIAARLDLSQVRLLPEESAKRNYNPYLTRLLTLYSQSRRTNAGTRGLDAFANATYAPTRLDDALAPAILSGDYALVIITGNAGDGKTAFIQKLEAQVKQNPANQFKALPTKNGAHFVYRGKEFLTNYDGSQDEGNVNNEVVLSRFFRPFAGNEPIHVDDRVHVIAINEGRLIDFLQSQQDEFPYLYRQVRDFFEFERETLTDPRLLIVNLNLRAIVAIGEQGSSILDQMLDRLAAPALWSKCATCDIAQQCYAKFNADSLNDPNYGLQIRARIKTLFQIAHLRRRLHITIRDLRSALAYMIAGTLDCDEIHALYNDPSKRSEYLGQFYYNALFESARSARTSQDRLVRLLSEADPGKTTNPRLDAELAFARQNELALLPPFDTRSKIDIELVQAHQDQIEALAQQFQIAAQTAKTDVKTMFENAARMIRQYYHISLRRKIFFERVDDGWKRMLPYTRFLEFLDLLTNQDRAALDNARDELIHAISLSEGILGEMGREYLCLRTAQDARVTIKSFRRFRKERFRCRVHAVAEQGRYIEYLPAMLILEYKDAENIRLEIGLDLYEMLYRIRQGYTPSLNELRGAYVNLLIFKRQLASTQYDEVLLTEDEESFYRVYQTTDRKLVLTQVNPG
jgi:serine/threonine protein kinase